MMDLNSILAMGFVGAFIMILMILGVFFIVTLINALVYHISTALLKIKGTSYSKAFKTVILSELYSIGIIIVLSIFLWILSLIPIIRVLIFVFNALLNLFGGVVFYYFLYKLGMKYYGINEKESLYAVLVTLVLNLLVGILLAILMVVLIGGLALLGFSQMNPSSLMP